MTSVLIRDPQGDFTYRRGDNVTTDEEIGGMHPQSRNSWSHQKLEKPKSRTSLRVIGGNSAPPAP